VLTAPVADAGMFTRVVRALDEAGIDAAELALRLPSLDEVFFALTGRHTGADKGEAGR
jgi:oleandomycin transport system ATP-binding protein